MALLFNADASLRYAAATEKLEMLKMLSSVAGKERYASVPRQKDV
jgi:hypothetical protein